MTRVGTWLLCAALVAGTGQPVSAHLGGQVTVPFWLTPLGVQETNAPVTVTWIDGDTDPTGVFTFRARQGNGPPQKHLVEGFTDGDTVAEVTILDPANSLLLTMEDLPTGAWSIVSETHDPPLCTVSAFAPILVVVQHDGDPMPMGGFFTKPFAMSSVADTSALINFAAVGETAPTVTLWAGVMKRVSDVDLMTIENPEDMCPHMLQDFNPTHQLLDGVALEADEEKGAGHWALEHSWDTTEVSEESYLLRAILTNDQGESTTVYSGGMFTVYHPEVPLGQRAEEDASMGADGTQEDVLEPNPDPRRSFDVSEDVTGDHEVAQRPDTGGCTSGESTGSGWVALAFLYAGLFGRRRRLRSSGF